MIVFLVRPDLELRRFQAYIELMGWVDKKNKNKKKKLIVTSFNRAEKKSRKSLKWLFKEAASQLESEI